MPKARYAIMQRYMPTQGRARSRHDVPHRHRAGQSRLRRREPTWWPRCGSGSRFSRSPPRSSPTRPSSAASRTATNPIAPRSGATPIRTGPGCFPSCSRRAWALSAMSTTRSMCRCISSTATAATSMLPAPRSAISCRAVSTQLPGVRPTFDDWADHLTTLFPDVRLKRFLEMRGADASSSLRRARIAAGLLDRAPLRCHRSWRGIGARRRLEPGGAEALRDSVPRLGLEAPFRGDKALRVAREAVAIAERGLMRRAQIGPSGEDERVHLAPLARHRARGPRTGGPAARRIRRMIGAATSTVCSTLAPFEPRRGRLGESQSCVAGGAFAARRAYRGLCVRRTGARLRAHALALARRLGLRSNLALGLDDFDLGKHQPHPPGYPIHVAAGKLLHLFLSNHATVLTLLSAFAGAAVASMFYLLVRRQLDAQSRLAPP